MAAEHDQDFPDLNRFRGLGEDPLFHPPVLTDRPRLWALDQWALAPRSLGYSDFDNVHWKGLRMLKDPDTQAAYQTLLWDLRPRTIIELGVYSGGSLVWFRDMTRAMGIDCRVVGIDLDLGNLRIPASEMHNITVRAGDCRQPSVLAELTEVSHPILFIDDAHCDSFNVMKWCVDHLLLNGDYYVVEDMMPTWYRYSPAKLLQSLAAFRKSLALDMVYANASPQLQGGVFRRLSAVEE